MPLGYQNTIFVNTKLLTDQKEALIFQHNETAMTETSQNPALLPTLVITYLQITI